MHRRRKGKSHSTRPISKQPPPWCKWKPGQVRRLIVDLARKGYSPTQIGLLLRDLHGIPLVKPITGKGILEILREEGLAPSIPEDLSNLLRKAAKLRRHLSAHRKDLSNQRNLQLTEAKIHRLAKYYKQEGILPPDWSYEKAIAAIG